MSFLILFYFKAVWEEHMYSFYSLVVFSAFFFGGVGSKIFGKGGGKTKHAMVLLVEQWWSYPMSDEQGVSYP